MEKRETAKHSFLRSILGNGDWLIAGVGAALVAISIGGVALKPLAAAAQSAVQGSPPPSTSTIIPVAAADGQPPFRERMMRRRAGPPSDTSGEQAAPPPPIDKHLTMDQVRDIVAGQLALSGNPNLKVGKATAKEESVVAVDITTKSGAVAYTREISTKTGLSAKLQKRMDERRAAMTRRGGRMGAEGGREHGVMAQRSHRFAGGMSHNAFERDNDRDLKLSADQAKKLTEARLIMMGNPHLKVGAVKEKDADTITVDIVASDNSLVTTREIDRHTGRPKRARG